MSEVKGNARGETGRGTVTSLLLGLCPRCRDAKVFSGLIAMRARCPRCGLVYEREPGYFVGAMYISYGASLVLMTGLIWLVMRAAPGLPVWGAIVVGLLLFVPLVPFVFRYSRLLWMYFDQSIDPS